MLDEIVVKYVPFASDFMDIASPDSQTPLSLPNALVDILKERQGVESNKDVRLYYRTHSITNISKDSSKEFKFLEMTDYFPQDREERRGRTSAPLNYYRFLNLDEGGRVTIEDRDLDEVNIEKDSEIVIVGYAHKIFVFKKEDYVDLKDCMAVINAIQ